MGRRSRSGSARVSSRRVLMSSALGTLAVTAALGQLCAPARAAGGVLEPIVGNGQTETTSYPPVQTAPSNVGQWVVKTNLGDAGAVHAMQLPPRPGETSSTRVL